MFATATSRTLARSLLVGRRSSNIHRSARKGALIRQLSVPPTTTTDVKPNAKENDNEDTAQAEANYRKAAEAINEKHKDLDRSLYTKPVPIKMPDLGAGSGKILEWFKQPGDVIVYEDVLCDIETTDFTFGMEIEDDEMGILEEIHVPKGTVVEPQTLICTILHETNSPDPPPEEEEDDDAPIDKNRKIPVTFEQRFLDEEKDEVGSSTKKEQDK